jgi:hypothetical protein
MVSTTSGAKQPGWFSRRSRTAEQHTKARESRELKTSLKISNAQERQLEYSKLSAEEKISLLNERFGEGLGAAKERARLIKVIGNRK